MQSLSVSSRYRVLRRLHVGGMAEVFLAVSEGTIARRVIVKRMLPELARMEEMRRRFAEEARLLSLLAGPGLPAVYDAGEDEHGPFLIAEFVQGANLREVLDGGGPLAPADVASVLGQALKILQRLHNARDDQGRALEFVHRDLAPENLQLDRGGGLWLLDLGIAKSRESQVRTGAGIRQGRAAYMSPEQLLGKTARAASDLYALALVGAELCGASLAGVPDEGGVTPAAAIERLARMAPAERASWPGGADPALREVIERLLTVEPDMRASHVEVLAALEQFPAAEGALGARVAGALAQPGTGGGGGARTPVLPGSFGARKSAAGRKKIVFGWVAFTALAGGIWGLTREDPASPWVVSPPPLPQNLPVISEGQVEVAIEVPSPGVFALRVDGRPLGEVRGRRAVQIDPGTHTFLLTEESTNRYYREDFLARLGETRLVRFPQEWGRDQQSTHQGEKEE